MITFKKIKGVYIVTVKDEVRTFCTPNEALKYIAARY